ncbi:MAG: hypothetical protein ABSC94_26870 [Polyangiaceae bacterium]|jgi:hypothetical protein
MNTAVQLRHAGDDAPQSDLVYGTPRTTVAGQLGPVALFSSGALVAYRIRHRRRTRTFVFRTLVVDNWHAASILGVRPRVHLLFDVRSEGRARLVRNMFRYLNETGPDPTALPDGFYLRVGVVLGGRLPKHKILPSLLSSPIGARSPTRSP